jgi:capsular polysaccharide biosynthesis protein
LAHYGTTLIEIHVSDDDPTEASAIANNIAEVYRVQRNSHASEIQEKNESTIIKNRIVDIVDQAEPDLRPVKPLPLMKILVPIAGLLAALIGVVLLILTVMRKDSAKKQPPPVPA